MTRYDLWLFLHVVAAIVWIGAGFLLMVLGTLAHRRRSPEAVGRVVEDTARLGPTYFVPASIAVVVFGILLVVDGPWSFSDAWVTIGLVGFAITFCTGLFLLKPRSERIAGLVEKAGEMTPEAYAESLKLLTIARIDYIVLFLVVFDMTVKPTSDDTWLLVLMAAVLVAGVGLVLSRVRSIEAEPFPG
jgi:uncharacterized membrane protein